MGVGLIVFFSLAEVFECFIKGSRDLCVGL